MAERYSTAWRITVEVRGPEAATIEDVRRMAQRNLPRAFLVVGVHKINPIYVVTDAYPVQEDLWAVQQEDEASTWPCDKQPDDSAAVKVTVAAECPECKGHGLVWKSSSSGLQTSAAACVTCPRCDGVAPGERTA